MIDSPIFVIGCPRSGTTLLSKLLAPTGWGSPVETQFIIKYAKKLTSYGDLAYRDNFCRLLKDILSERAIMQWKLTIDLDSFFDELPVKSYRNLINALCMKRFGGLGKQSWGDKTPHYIRNFEMLYNLFPDSRYLYIVRDGRDTALSLLQVPWGPNNVFACAEYWQYSNRERPIFEELRNQGKLLDVGYESLLDRPEEVVRKIYNFLGAPFPDEETSKLIKTIKPGNYNKWKNQMSIKQRRRFEAVAGDTLRRFGYETEFLEESTSDIEKIFWRSIDRFLYINHLIKINTVDTIRIRFFGMDPFSD